jgi:hypothetical protein
MLGRVLLHLTMPLAQTVALRVRSHGRLLPHLSKFLEAPAMARRVLQHIICVMLTHGLPRVTRGPVELPLLAMTWACGGDVDCPRHQP